MDVQVVLLPAFARCGRLIGYNVTANSPLNARLKRSAIRWDGLPNQTITNHNCAYLAEVNRKDEDVCRLQDTLLRSCGMACVRALVIILYSSWYLQVEAASSEGG